MESRSSDVSQKLDYAGRREQLVTVVTFHSEFEANLARNKLESEGFHVVLDNDHISSIGGSLYAAVTGGIKLQVPEGEAEAAREALPRRAFHAIHRCPNCASEKTGKAPAPQGFFAAWTHSLLSLFVQMPWTCADCGHRWIPQVDDADDDDENE